MNINGGVHDIAFAAILCNETESLHGYGIYGETIFNANRFLIIYLLLIKTDGSILTMVIDMMPFVRATRVAQRGRAGLCIRNLYNYLTAMGLHAFFIRDKGKGTNPTPVELGIDIETITCVVHDIDNLLDEVSKMDQMRIGNVGINIRALKAAFNEANINNDCVDEKALIKEFWGIFNKMSDKKFSFYKNLTDSNYLTRMRHFLTRCQWRVIDNASMAQFQLYLDFLAHIESLIRLIHEPMNQNNAATFQILIDYFMTIAIREGTNPLIPVLNCLRFFIRAYRRSLVPFIPAYLSILIIYLIKGKIVIIMCGGKMPSLSFYTRFFSECVNEGKGEIESCSEYGNGTVNIVRTIEDLRGTFLTYGVMPALNFNAIDMTLALSLSSFEELQGVDINLIGEAARYVTKAIDSIYRLPRNLPLEIRRLINIISELMSLKNVRRKRHI